MKMMKAGVWYEVYRMITIPDDGASVDEAIRTGLKEGWIKEVDSSNISKMEDTIMSSQLGFRVMEDEDV